MFPSLVAEALSVSMVTEPSIVTAPLISKSEPALLDKVIFPVRVIPSGPVIVNAPISFPLPTAPIVTVSPATSPPDASASRVTPISLSAAPIMELISIAPPSLSTSRVVLAAK